MKPSDILRTKFRLPTVSTTGIATGTLAASGALLVPRASSTPGDDVCLWPHQSSSIIIRQRTHAAKTLSVKAEETLDVLSGIDADPVGQFACTPPAAGARSAPVSSEHAAGFLR